MSEVDTYCGVQLEKGERKLVTKIFVTLHNHSPLLTLKQTFTVCLGGEPLFSAIFYSQNANDFFSCTHLRRMPK